MSKKLPREISRYLDHIEELVDRARADLSEPSTLEYKHTRVMIPLTTGIIWDLAHLTAEMTDEPTRLVRSSAEAVLDEIGECFAAAIDKRDDRKSTDSKAAAKADFARSMA